MGIAEPLAVEASGGSTFAAGDLLSERYVLDHPLRVGGMGVVWVAHSKALNMPVALKVLRSRVSTPEAVERMANEAHAAASLGHPAIVRVLDFGEAGDAPFIAMELLEGEDLSEILARQGKLIPTEAVGLLLPIIDGLATAHQKGIVHRDIKPENIFIARDTLGRVQPKVLDFGIAKLTDGRNKTKLTQTGALLGTPQYLSPEQAYGREDVDFRTDIWSVGVVLYELVTGTHPFAGNNYNALIRSITQDQHLRNRNVGDEQLWGIIDRCLQKEADERWESLWALGEALALWLVERGIEVDAASRSLREGWLESGITGLSVLVPGSVVVSPPASPPLLPPRSKPRKLDSIGRAAVVTVQHADRRPRSGAGRAFGAALLIAVPFIWWASHHTTSQTSSNGGHLLVRAATTAPPERRIVPRPLALPNEALPSTIAEPPRPEPAAPLASALPAKSIPSRSAAHGTPVRKAATIDPEFGF